MIRSALAVAALVVVAAGLTVRSDPDRALASITTADLRAHLRYLSDDLLEGRAPGTRGGRLTERYIAAEFERIGLESVDRGYEQPVGLVGSATRAEGSSLSFGTAGGALRAEQGVDAVLWSPAADTAAAVTGELVFAGYGVHAPEYGWDDFEGFDPTGKILLVLVNDPPAPPDDPTRFRGRALTYYGRWTYKLEEAARRGAAGVLIVHTPAAAGYSWGVVRSSWAGERLMLPRRGTEPDPVRLAGWITRDRTREILDRADLTLEELYVRAARKDFRPVPTGITVRARVRSDVRALSAANVLGWIPGGHPERRDEIVVYTAHHDHLGVGPAVDGDSIYNGAYDNASGVSALAEIAEAFVRLDEPPDRTVVFVATTGEEAGMLGAEQYVRSPPFPLSRTVAAINIDGANLWGATDDVSAVGGGRSTLGRTVERRADELGLRMVAGDARGQGLFFRSDHFPFARAGVPALAIEHGLDYRARPDGWGRDHMGRYGTRHYHRPSDEYDEDFDLRGAVQQTRLAFLVGYDVAMADEAPRWYDGAGVGPFTSSPPR